ncbi:gamma-glutamyltransferase family protein [Aliihoeflea aestuarii]|jgi:gamma-glutamyltranspeptidase / glutathione hydrolase|uniref:gamma-glutamyltransferase family protein n=1 Tax=Aliihoeflea aestuarii TaxID=453840 RepID=UPI0020931F55|nr:gamma-glutamyltransferase family protein [Aliihoeflea aestuarii]
MRNFDLPGRSAVYAENGMAATSHPLATMTALSVLKSGGNAVDAAIAACATLCVVEPHMTGIGGDCFVILAEPDGTIHGLNGSGRAPMGAEAERYRALGHDKVPTFGALAVTVPGAIDAWEKLARRFGTKGFDELFADAIRYGEDGYAIHGRVARDWPKAVEWLAKDEGGAQHYLTGGKAPIVGSRHSAPALAATFRAIAKDGAKAFYQGEIGAEIAATVKAKGGFLTEDDLAAVSADWVDTISVSYGDLDVHEIPPNGQGITALILLRLLAKLGAAELAPDSAERAHLEIEAARLAYSVRDHLVADPKTMTVTPAELLSDAYIDRLAARFDPARRIGDVTPPDMPASDTVYLTVVDRDRRAVSFINSTYHAFGSRVVTPKSGIALQNRGAGFSLVAGHPNEIGPGKRPMHTIIPAMATRGGKPAISFGVMGGDYQPMGHAHVMSNMVDHGMDPQQAIDHPRIFWGDDDEALRVEAGIGSAVRSDLEARGHTVRDAESPHGGGQAIVIDEASGFLIGGSDPRKDGCAMGW